MTKNGNQCTVVWHVDDIKISCIEEKVVERFIKLIKDKYETDEVGKVKVQ